MPVESIAEDLLGLRIREGNLEVSGMLIPSEREIWLNRADAAYPGRQRFTLAHELGHWIHHCREQQEMPAVLCRTEDVTLGADRAKEREANIFAAELLMPEDAVRQSADAPAAAAIFGVSRAAMSWRLYSFGLSEPPLVGSEQEPA